MIFIATPTASACYVLAAMLRAQASAKQITTEETANGRLLIYEHGATGDVFIVTDPRLRLDELEGVQMKSQAFSKPPRIIGYRYMLSALPWFPNAFRFTSRRWPVWSDKIFRQLCKEYGADVLTTEFVSAEGIFRRNERRANISTSTRSSDQIGVQLFGADAGHMAEAARQVIDWVRPDFIDLNFGCPVQQSGREKWRSALLKIARCWPLSQPRWLALLRRCPRHRQDSDRLDARFDHASRVARSLSMQESRRHSPRTHPSAGLCRSGRLDTIAGGGSSRSNPRHRKTEISPAPLMFAKRRNETGIAGAMIGRAAMSAAMDLQQTKQYLATGQIPDPPDLTENGS